MFPFCKVFRRFPDPWDSLSCFETLPWIRSPYRPHRTAPHVYGRMMGWGRAVQEEVKRSACTIMRTTSMPDLGKNLAPQTGSLFHQNLRCARHVALKTYRRFDMRAVVPARPSPPLQVKRSACTIMGHPVE